MACVCRAATPTGLPRNGRGAMNIQLLHINECPNWEETGTLLRNALNAVGKSDVAIETVLLNTPEEAAEYAFAGSPTILIDGEDPFPNGGTTTDLACRVYNTGARLAGSPTEAQITQVLRAHL